MNIIDITSKIPICNYSKGRYDKVSGKTYKPEGVVLHITADSERGKAVSWFENPVSCVSSNYIIEKNGDIFKCVDPLNKAYHCGEVKTPTADIYFDKGSVNPNLYMVGIECVSSGEPLTDEQYISLVWLLKELRNDLEIALDRYHVIGHYELDTITRKDDPIASYSVDDILRRTEVINVINPITDLNEAINFLVAEKVLNGAEYRTKVCDVVNYEKEFTLAAANKIIEYKNQLNK